MVKRTLSGIKAAQEILRGKDSAATTEQRHMNAVSEWLPLLLCAAGGGYLLIDYLAFLVTSVLGYMTYPALLVATIAGVLTQHRMHAQVMMNSIGFSGPLITFACSRANNKTRPHALLQGECVPWRPLWCASSILNPKSQT